MSVSAKCVLAEPGRVKHGLVFGLATCPSLASADSASPPHCNGDSFSQALPAHRFLVHGAVRSGHQGIQREPGTLRRHVRNNRLTGHSICVRERAADGCMHASLSSLHRSVGRSHIGIALRSGTLDRAAEVQPGRDREGGGRGDRGCLVFVLASPIVDFVTEARLSKTRG